MVELRLDQNLRARIDASDVVQEAQLEAFQRLDDFLSRKPMPFRIWLRKTAYEILIKLREKHVAAARRSVDQEEPLPGKTTVQLAQRLWAGGPSPSQQAINREQARQVHQGLEELTQTDREILVMRYLEKLSNREIGYILELHPDTVSKRHGRALLKLEKVLRDKGLGESSL